MGETEPRTTEHDMLAQFVFLHSSILDTKKSCTVFENMVMLLMIAVRRRVTWGITKYGPTERETTKYSAQPPQGCTGEARLTACLVMRSQIDVTFSNGGATSIALAGSGLLTRPYLFSPCGTYPSLYY